MQIPLGELAYVRTGLVLGRKKVDDALPGYEYESITLKCFGEDGKFLRDETDRFFAKEELANDYLTREGDIVVRLRAPVRAIHIDKPEEGLLINSLLAVIRLKTPELDPRYLCDFLNSTTAQKQFTEMVKGTAITMLKSKDLERLRVVVPPLETQRKLVNYHTTARHELELLERRLQAGRQLAHGVFETVLHRYKEENR